MSTVLPSYVSTSRVSCYITPETGTSHTSAPPGFAALLALPTAAATLDVTTYLGYTNSPAITSSEGSQPAMSVGAFAPVFLTRGTREFSFNVRMDIGVGDTANLLKLMPNQQYNNGGSVDGFGGTGDWCLTFNVAGPGASTTGAYRRVFRFCKVNSITITLQEGSASRVTADINFTPLAEGIALIPTALNPTLAQLQAPSTPLMWHNLFSVTVGGNEYHNCLMSASFTATYTNEAKSVTLDVGDSSDISRIHGAILPHGYNVTGDIRWHQDVPASLVNAAATSVVWGDVVAVCKNVGSSTVANVAGFTLTLVNAMLASRDQAAAEAPSQLNFGTSLIGTGLTMVSTTT